MRKYRLFAGIAAVLIAGAGVLSITAGGTPAVPPPVTLRGSAPDSTVATSDGLGFVPPTVVELDPEVVTDEGELPTVDPGQSADSPEFSPTVPPDGDSPDVASADSPDVAPADAPDGDSPDVADPVSADSPDVADPVSADSPDQPEADDSADSPDE